MELEVKIKWSEYLKWAATCAYFLAMPLSVVYFAYTWGPEEVEVKVALWAAVGFYFKIIIIGILAQASWYMVSVSALKELKREEDKLESEARKSIEEASKAKGYH